MSVRGRSLGVVLGCMTEELRLEVSAGASARLWVFSRTGAVARQYNCGQRRCCCEPALRWCLDTAQPSAKLQTDAFDQTLGDGGSSRACNGPPCDTSRPRTSQRSPRARPTQPQHRWAKGAEFLRMSSTWETTAATAKMRSVLLGSANAASTECALHAGRGASLRRYVGARGKIAFVSAVRDFSRPGS